MIVVKPSEENTKMAAKEVDMSLMSQVMREEEMRRVKEETKMENNNEEDEDNVYQEDNNENANNYDNEDDGSGGDCHEPEEDESQDSTMMELKMEGFVKEEAFDTPEKKVSLFILTCCFTRVI